MIWFIFLRWFWLLCRENTVGGKSERRVNRTLQWYRLHGFAVSDWRYILEVEPAGFAVEWNVMDEGKEEQGGPHCLAIVALLTEMDKTGVGLGGEN